MDLQGSQSRELMNLNKERSSYAGNISRGSNSHGDEAAMVGFEDESMKLVERLTGMQRRIDLISIVGMAGIGKTTLARKVYNDPLIVYHFHIRAWAAVSQVHRKRDILLAILSCIFKLITEIYEMSTDKLCEFVRQRLMGSRYLIVLDDIWDIRAWDDLKRCFPDNNEGSRIMFTSRLTEIPSQSQSNTYTHTLRFLTRKKSWVLLKEKVFGNGSCPRELTEIGKQIARKCQGLPLAIVVIAGVLANEKTPEWWNQVVASVSSYIVSDQNQYMKTLMLSYNNLPGHLKPCFLYLGQFPEDSEIPVRNLIWLWIAEGFIHKKWGKCMEAVAEEYLADLISRSLVIVSKRHFDGDIKACRLHDLLRDLCLMKAKEENFFYQKFWYDKDGPDSMPSGLRYTGTGEIEGKSIICEDLKFLKVLVLSHNYCVLFPTEILQLVELRYLALQMNNPTVGQPASIPASLSNLVHLETLILLSSSGCMIVTLNIWKMVNLRHLYIKSSIKETDTFFGLQPISGGCPPILENLQTISFVNPSSSCQQVLELSPNLQKLGVCGPLISNSGELTFPYLGFSNHLQTLTLCNTVVRLQAASSCNPIKFPERLKKLTLINTALKWEDMWTIGMLENLEVLKLKDYACLGQKWETSDWGFRRLKFLKLEKLDLSQWSASSDNFPSLRRLVLHTCRILVKIPLGLGDIPTLEMIEVNHCNNNVVDSAHEIQIEQLNKGNDWLKILIHQKFLEPFELDF